MAYYVNNRQDYNEKPLEGPSNLGLSVILLFS